MKAKEVEKILIQNGWEFKRQVGSHKMFKKDGNPSTIAVPFHSSQDLAIGTLKNIFKKAGIE